MAEKLLSATAIDAPSWQPARDLQQRLPGPVGQLLVPLALLGGVALGGRQHGQEGQAPDAAGPGYGGQQHDAEPAQAAGLDEVAVAGADRVTVDPARLDLRAPAPLDRIVKADHHRPRRGQTATSSSSSRCATAREDQRPVLSTRW